MDDIISPTYGCCFCSLTIKKRVFEQQRCQQHETCSVILIAKFVIASVVLLHCFVAFPDHRIHPSVTDLATPGCSPGTRQNVYHVKQKSTRSILFTRSIFLFIIFARRVWQKLITDQVFFMYSAEAAEPNFH